MKTSIEPTHVGADCFAKFRSRRMRISKTRFSNEPVQVVLKFFEEQAARKKTVRRSAYRKTYNNNV